MDDHRDVGAAGADGAAAAAIRPMTLGVVSFLNTLPLIDGLDRLENLRLKQSVPSLLIDALLDREVDLALCSSIDYQHSPVPLKFVPAGQLGCDGATMTVRLYSTTPVSEITRVYCDTDSHTSVILLQIILRQVYGVSPEIIPYNAREHVAENVPLEWPAAMLLIGDKVVTDSPPAVRYPHQLDLGEAWKNLTGLPFVFAMWVCRADSDPEQILRAAVTLDRQRRHNRERIDGMLTRLSDSRRWPRDLASSYLREYLRYEVTESSLAGLRRFHELAFELGLTERCRPLELVSLAGSSEE